MVSTDVSRDVLTIDGTELVRWYPSSPRVRRGFCANCGSTLFWDSVDRDWIGVAMGLFDEATDTSIALHVHVGEKGDYYCLPADEPQFATVPSVHL